MKRLLLTPTDYAHHVTHKKTRAYVEPVPAKTPLFLSLCLLMHLTKSK
jgi:hypothetical protein